MRSVLTNVVVALAVAGALAAGPVRAVPTDEVQSVFSQFIGAQNAHDLDGVRRLLSDSPDFLWVFPGRVVRSQSAALDGLRELFKGQWRVEPDWSTFQVLGLDVSTVEIFVRASIHGDSLVRMAQMNLILVDTTRGWRISSIVVSNVPPDRDIRYEPPDAAPSASGIASR